MKKVIYITAAVFICLFTAAYESSGALAPVAETVPRSGITHHKKLSPAIPVKKRAYRMIAEATIDAHPVKRTVCCKSSCGGKEEVYAETIVRTVCSLLYKRIEDLGDDTLSVIESNEEDKRVETEIFTPVAVEMKLKVFPNPMTTEARIEIENYNDEPYNIEIYDLSGKLVRQQSSLTGNVFVMQREDLPAGIYIWRFVSGANNVKSGKLIAA